jgi:hypothetical protein
MAKTETSNRRSKLKGGKNYSEDAPFILTFAVLSVLYVALAFLPTPDPGTLQHYHLSTTSYRWLILPIVIFFVIIWLTALYGSLRIKQYARIIRGSREATGLDILSSGFMALALMLPLTSDLSSLANSISRYHETYREPLTIIINYVNLVVMAVALSLIAGGAEKLAALANRKHLQLPENFWVLGFIIISSLYGYFLISQPSEKSLAVRPYYLPHWAVLVTLAMPYLYFWYRGFKGAYMLFEYQKNVRGWLYKKALRYLAAGVSVVVLSSVLTRMLTTIPSQLNHLNLTPVLVIIFGLLAVIAIGYGLIALGANRLRKIEEV